MAREAPQDIGEGVQVEVPGQTRVVDGAREAPVGEPGRAVEHRSRRAGDADAEVRSQVPALQGSRAVHGDAGRPTVARDGDVEARGPALDEAPQRQGGGVAERGPGAAGEDGGRRPLERGLRRTADGVDAGVDAVEAAELDAVGDYLVAQSELAQLPACDVPVLAVRQAGDGYFCAYV